MLTALDIPFADTTAESLSWWLGAAPESLDELVLQADHGTLVLRLLGASHQAVASVADLEVPEVVACGREPAGLPATAGHDLPGGRYRFSSATSVYAEPGLARVARDLRRRWADDPAAVVGVFPGSPHALTVLSGSGTERGWSWRTWHVYPTALQVVRTRSTLVAT